MTEGYGYSFVGEGNLDFAGLHTYTVGDINDDGYDDFVIGASQYGRSRMMHGYGKAYLFLGRPTNQWTSKPLSEAAMSFVGETISDALGRWIASLGDVNGDGFDDFAISAVGYGNWKGKTYIFFGKSAISWGPDTPVAQAANASFIGEAEDDHSGHGIYGVGDVNNDGYNDLLISGEWNDEGGMDSGQVYLILGRPTSQWTKDTQLPQAANASFIGNTTTLFLGFDAAGIGDVNNDGYTDFAIGAIKNNDPAVNISQYITILDLPPTLPSRQVFIVLGRPTQQWQMNQSISEANASMLFERWWGPSNDFISGVSDVNNDGFDDFLIGANMDDAGGPNAGQTYLFLGRPTGQWIMGTAISQANASFTSEIPHDWSGWDVAGAHDVNNDGYSDFLIAAVNDLFNPNNEGSVYLFFGGPTDQWQSTLPLSHANHTFIGENPGDSFGGHVAGVGDVNGDGFDDFMIAAVGYEGSTGKVYLLLGNSTLAPPPPEPTTTTTTTTEDTNGARAGFLVIIPFLAVLALIRKKQRKKLLSGENRYLLDRNIFPKL